MAQESLVYHNHLFAQSLTPPAMVSAHHMTPPPSQDTTTTIKMEDLNIPAGYSTPSRTSTAQSTPPATEQKPVKKRKSWGQVLPEPKTNLPPRKRAKTEDEKEQRRIERVKRNRLAAHNSRERKRQEVEHLQHEKDQLAEELKQAKARMARMAAQLRAFQQRHPDEVIETLDDFDYNTPSPSDFARESSETVCPRQTSFPSPISMDSMNSPRDSSCQPETPSYAESVAPELDPTRYPAAILCDLQYAGFSFSLPHATSALPALVDEKPIMDDLFNFDQFPEHTNNVNNNTNAINHTININSANANGNNSMTFHNNTNTNNNVDNIPSTSHLDTTDFFSDSFFDSSVSNPYGLNDSYDAKCFDLQTTSGATNVSDGVIASEH